VAGDDGYPFVFAVWAVRTDAFSSLQQAAEITRDFQRARAEGLRQLESIATRYAPELGLPSGDLLSYLQTNVNYDLDPDNLAGLSKYYELSASYGSDS
jgi:predicted solute-binding protein